MHIARILEYKADKGTLFLDEIGELPMTIQKSFLRVIQEHRFRPVGGSQEINSDFRLVGATNRSLEDLVQQGQFREDLLFRLRSLVIELPPLRECLDDLKELTLHYMGTLCRRFGLEPKGFSQEFWNTVSNYKWPGNVRELIQALEKALLAAKEEPILYLIHLRPTSASRWRATALKNCHSTANPIEPGQLPGIPIFIWHHS